MSKLKSSPRLRFTGAAILLSALLFLVPAVKDGNEQLYLLALLVPCGMLLVGTVLARVFSLDRLILNLTLWICAAGIAAYAFTDPAAALAHALNCGAGMAVLLVGGILIRSLSNSLLTSVCTAFLGILLLAGKILSPTLAFSVASRGQNSFPHSGIFGHRGRPGASADRLYLPAFPPGTHLRCPHGARGAGPAALYR